MAKIKLLPKKEQLNDLITFLDDEFKSLKCNKRIIHDIYIAVEEWFINIVSYSKIEKNEYIDIEVLINKQEFIIIFKNKGIRFNPLEHLDPDTTLSSNKRPIGGLGILMMKKLMDNVSYDFKDSKNIVTLSKKLS